MPSTPEIDADIQQRYDNARLQQEVGDIYGSIASLRQVMELAPDRPDIAPDLMIYLDQVTDDFRFTRPERRRYDERWCKPLRARSKPHTNDPDPERRLNVGYLSADFWDHSVMMAVSPVLEHRDPTRIKQHFYMTNPVKDHETERFKRLADVWRPVYKEGPHHLAEIVRKDRIDILVDLSGYTYGQRQLALAEQPAPIQVTAWGSGNGTGLAHIDYLLSDEVMIGPEDEANYRERPLRLPCFMSYKRDPEMPPLSPAPYEKNGYVTFGNLGRGGKITQEMLVAWSTVLTLVPDARLVLKWSDSDHVGMAVRMINVLTALGVDHRRITLYSKSDRASHLKIYEEIDLILDTFPENGGVTTLEACAMSVPVVTRRGRTAASRLTASILRQIGVKDTPDSTDAYIDRAVALAHDPDFLATERTTIRDRFFSSIICDAPAMTRAWESELRRVWQSWCSHNA